MRSPIRSLRERLPSSAGNMFWRAPEDIGKSINSTQGNDAEFTSGIETWEEGISRRRFLELAGAGLALSGASGCSPRPAPSEEIIPYVKMPEEIIPGRPQFYATAHVHQEMALGILVESHEGRPTKIEGNPDHPASLGGTDIFAQAAILDLYDPDRSKTVLHHGQISTWGAVHSSLRSALQAELELEGAAGKGLCLLVGEIRSPTLHAQLRKLKQRFPMMRIYQHVVGNRENVKRGAELAFGKMLETYHDLTEATLVVSFGDDFLCESPTRCRESQTFMAARRDAIDQDGSSMSRLYVIEQMLSCTGAKADHRIALPNTQIDSFARMVAKELGMPAPDATVSLPALSRTAKVIAKDLLRCRGRSVVKAGPDQSASVHALTQAMNAYLENTNRTVFHMSPFWDGRLKLDSNLGSLVNEIRNGSVETMIIIGTNPGYSAPADIDFIAALKSQGTRRSDLLCFHMGAYFDETAELCDWHLPQSHFLESWSDAIAFDGTATITQPLIEPLYDSRSDHELITFLTGFQEEMSRETVRHHWREWWESHELSGTFDEFWDRSVQTGTVDGTRRTTVNVEVIADWWRSLDGARPSEEGVVISFALDPTIGDGAFANNAWLQELPKPVTRITWDAPALLSPRLAERLGLTVEVGSKGGDHGEAVVDCVELSYRGRAMVVPAWIAPGHADNSVTLWLGHGRTSAGRVGNGSGFNAYQLRRSEAPWTDQGLIVRKVDRQHIVASVQMQNRMNESRPIRTAAINSFGLDSGVAKTQSQNSELLTVLQPEELLSLKSDRPLEGSSPTLYPEYDYGPPNHRWGMAIDLTSCIGCQACVIACQAENNIPVVGKSEVIRGREMHWIRVDRYFSSSLDDPQTHFQPVPCMQCENAPCELVCPVHATVHSSDGLNDMVYNRCVGTRYCSNNCPFKVRRFNFFEYSDYKTESRRLGRNPDVTVRTRGVMEKCTYCVQRIREGVINAKVGHRDIKDGEILTACQQACPTRAIQFGDLNNHESVVVRWKNSSRNYSLLEELDVRPRTTYLAELRNPNPELTGGRDDGHR